MVPSKAWGVLRVTPCGVVATGGRGRRALRGGGREPPLVTPPDPVSKGSWTTTSGATNVPEGGIGGWVVSRGGWTGGMTGGVVGVENTQRQRSESRVT